MLENRMTSENKEESLKKQVSCDSRGLDEVVDYVLDNKNSPTKAIEALSIVHDDKNILMMLLESQKFDLLAKLLEVPSLIFSSQKVLRYPDKRGRDVLSYFLEFAPVDLLQKCLELLKLHCPPEDLKAIFKNKRKDGKNPIMILCSDKRSIELDDVFKTMVDSLASVCGLDSLYNAFTSGDMNDDNALMVAIKNKNFSVGNRILDLIEKTVSDQNERSRIENEIVMRCDSQSNNPLMLLSIYSCEETRQLQQRVIEIIKNNSAASLGRANLDGNNALMLAMIYGNDSLAQGIIESIKSTQNHSKPLLLTQLCNQSNTSGENFITLAFKSKKTNVFLSLFEEIQSNLPPEQITDLFKKTLSSNSELLHLALSATDTKAIISIIKNIIKIKELSPSDREKMSNLVTRRDSTKKTLLHQAIEQSNVEVCTLVLNVIKEFCSNLTITLMLTARDSKGETSYMSSKDNQKVQEIIEDFARDTGNYKYLELQQKELTLATKQQQSGIFKITFKAFH